MPESETPFGGWDPTSLDKTDIVYLQSYIDNVFRLIIFIFGLSISILFFIEQNYFIELLVSIMILMSIAYSYYTIYKVGNLLYKTPEYSEFNLSFYYIETTCLLLLYITLMYVYFRKIIRKKTYFDKRNINGEIVEL